VRYNASLGASFINSKLFIFTGQPHEGSAYAAQKDLTLSYHRMDHIKSRLLDLEKIHTLIL